MFKLVFRCPALNERRFWYVSGESEARRTIRQHMTTAKRRRLEKYRDMVAGVDFFVELTPTFGGYDPSGVDTLNWP